MNDTGLSEVQRVQVWERWAGGESLRSIGRALGAPRQWVVRLVASTGGCRPAPRRRAARALQVWEREEISRGLAAGSSCRQIALELGRASSTISREVARNGGRGGYRAGPADAATWQRARRPKPAKLKGNLELRAIVEERLRLCWSPEQIAGWLVRTYPADTSMHVSHETIYLSLFVQSRGALKRELTRYLRTHRTMRTPGKARLPQGQGQIRDAVPISQRPPEVADRAVPGHWEGDLLMGIRPSAIGTLTERSSRYVMLFALPDGYTADRVREALATSIQTLPNGLWRSLTWDRGHEMAEHARFTIDTGVQVYFCDPQSPWQRGSAENTNGLLRQYLPRASNLNHLTQPELDAIADELNARPRKTLGWVTPSDTLAQAMH